jgi:hypothetical protein
VNFVASFGTNTKVAGIAYELNALVCSLFNQVCQLFSINIASVFILVKFNTVYTTVFHAGKRFLLVLLFCTSVTEQLKLIEFLLLLSAFILPSSQVFLILIKQAHVIITSAQFSLF